MSENENLKRNGLQLTSRKVIVVVASLTFAIGGLFAVDAISQTNTFGHMKLIAEEGGSWQKASFRGRHHGGLFKMSDEQIEAKATRLVKHIAIEIDANEEQQKKITTLVIALFKDMKPARELMHSTRTEIKALLLTETVDRQALEKLRVERLAEADRLSKNLVGAMADVADILTFEQRKILEERINDFRHGHRRGHGKKHHDRG